VLRALFETIRSALRSLGANRLRSALMDFSVFGGSLGVAVGETFCRACELSLEKRLPLLAVTTSGNPSDRIVDQILLTRQKHTGGFYLFNLGTSGLSTGTWYLGVDLHDGVGVRKVKVGLRP
jgi:hypothetical protein